MFNHLFFPSSFEPLSQSSLNIFTCQSVSSFMQNNNYTIEPTFMPSVFEPLSPCLKPLSIPKTAEPTNFFTPQFLEPLFIQQLYCTSPPLGPTVLQRFNSIFLEMSLNISSYLFMQKTYLHNINLAHLSSSSKPSEPLCPTLKTTKPPASKVPLQLMSFNVSALQSSSYLQIHAVPHLT